MKKRHISLPTQLPAGVARKPFSDAVRAGDTLYLSGCIGLDAANGRPPSDVATEARLVMEQMKRVLAAADLTLDDLVQVQIFAPDVSHFGAFNAVYCGYFEGPLPARAFIGSGPLLFGARFEVMGIAAYTE